MKIKPLSEVAVSLCKQLSKVTGALAEVIAALGGHSCSEVTAALGGHSWQANKRIKSLVNGTKLGME